jgi:hypothetical protein
MASNPGQAPRLARLLVKWVKREAHQKARNLLLIPCGQRAQFLWKSNYNTDKDLCIEWRSEPLCVLPRSSPNSCSALFSNSKRYKSERRRKIVLLLARKTRSISLTQTTADVRVSAEGWLHPAFGKTVGGKTRVWLAGHGAFGPSQYILNWENYCVNPCLRRDWRPPENRTNKFTKTLRRSPDEKRQFSQK